VRLAGRAVALVAVALPIVAAAARGQTMSPVVGVAVGADSILVGEPFELSFRVDLPAAAEVRFPAVLPLPEDIEQRGAVRIESHDGGRAWRARYLLAAWRADSIPVAAVEALVQPEGEQEFPISLAIPVVLVRSVLPADETDLELREARPFLTLRTFPWWLLLVFAAVAAAAWAWWRRRLPATAGIGAVGPAAIALGEFERLRGQWRGGELGLGQFYDQFESALRRYARATRNWSPSVALTGLASGGDLIGVLRRSTVVRFAHAAAPVSGPDAALDAGTAFVEAEIPATDEGDEGDDASAAGPHREADG